MVRYENVQMHCPGEVYDGILLDNSDPKGDNYFRWHFLDRINYLRKFLDENLTKRIVVLYPAFMEDYNLSYFFEGQYTVIYEEAKAKYVRGMINRKVLYRVLTIFHYEEGGEGYRYKVDENKEQDLDIVSIKLQDDLEKIPSEFLNKYTLKDVYLGKGIKKIPDKTFYDCCQLEYVEFASDHLEIGKEAFAECCSLEEVIWEKLQSGEIGDESFLNCTNLENINLNVFRLIGKRAFEGCKSLDTIWPYKVEEIGDYAFHKTGIRELWLPKTTRSIGNYAFKGTNLKFIHMRKNVENIAYDAFTGCKHVILVIIEESDDDAPGEVINFSSLRDVAFFLPKCYQEKEKVIFPEYGEYNVTFFNSGEIYGGASYDVSGRYCKVKTADGEKNFRL